MQPYGTGGRAKERLWHFEELSEKGGVCRRCNRNKFSSVRRLYEWVLGELA